MKMVCRKLTEEMWIPLRPIPREDSSSLTFLWTGQVREIDRPKYLIHGRSLSSICFFGTVFSLLKEGMRLFVGWLLNVPATCECIPGIDLLRQFYVLTHWERSCRSNFPSHPVIVYWHRANQSQRQAPGRVATGVPILKSLVWLEPGKIPAQVRFEPGIFRSRGGRLNH